MNSPSPPAPPPKQLPDDAPFDFQLFLDQIKLRSAEPVAKYLKSFLSNFTKRTFTLNDQIKIINDFLNFISKQMRECEPWKTVSEQEFDNAMEGMEKLVMNQLYQYTFTPAISSTLPRRPLTTDDLERDRVLSQRISLFSSWIQEKHLDIPVAEGSKGFIMFAEQELLKINHYKAPRDKLICVLNCCKVIYGLIRHLGAASQKEKEKLVDVEDSGDTKPSITGSADDFLPILIFVVIKSNPPHLISNLEFIQRFRNPAKLSSEAGYYLSSLYGAVSFVETMDYASLSGISKEEFEQELERVIQVQEGGEGSGGISRTSSSSSSETSLSTPTSTPSQQQVNPMMNHETSSGSATPLNLPNLPNISTLTRELRDLSVGEDAKRLLQKTGDAMKNPLNRIGKMFSEALDSFEGQGQGPGGQQSGQSSHPGNGAGNTPTSRPSTPSLFSHLNQVEETPAGGGGYPDQAPIQTPYKPRVRRGPSSSSPSPGPGSAAGSPGGAWGGGWEDTPSRIGRPGQQPSGPFTNSPLALGPSQSYSQPQSHLGVAPPPRLQSLPGGGAGTGGLRSTSRTHSPSNSGSGSGLWSLFGGSGLGDRGQGGGAPPQVPHHTHPSSAPHQPQPTTNSGSGLNLNLWGSNSRSSTPLSAEFDFISQLSPFSSSTTSSSQQPLTSSSQYSYLTSSSAEAEFEAAAAQSEFERATMERTERETREKTDTLRQMFPSMDAEVVGWVLEANDGDVGRCVEVLLEMGGGESGGGGGGEEGGETNQDQARGYDLGSAEDNQSQETGTGRDGELIPVLTSTSTTTLTPTNAPTASESISLASGTETTPKPISDSKEPPASTTSASNSGLGSTTDSTSISTPTSATSGTTATLEPSSPKDPTMTSRSTDEDPSHEQTASSPSKS
ncbi:hypothetical protein K435DRAFT_963018 [Dendrothele bispora CBS 962.96]|uniref:VPS9 domain-containing protein n=1 Tax=Dendrothele bispora (strain CBS 962.96) TaxID=1314807 RepID=A0A4S8MJX4_DENBC|nr:hypothetical protein K435DRAFT_963018 [Dendrothele bispora CBS 962.96]